MPLTLTGVTLGYEPGGPSSTRLYDLADVSIVNPQSGQYLRYNTAIAEWQNTPIETDLYNFFDTNVVGTNGINVAYTPGPDIVNFSLNLAATGDASGTVSSGSLPITLATVNSNVGTFGSSSSVPVFTVNSKGLVTGVTNTAIASASSSGTLAGGSPGAIVYQSAPGTSAFLPATTSSQVLVSGTSPSWTNTPVLTGTNFSGIPNSSLINASVTIGSTVVALGSTVTSLAGLTTITATTFNGTFSGTMSGNATTATSLATGRTFSASGDATGTSVAFNGSANATIPITLATVGTAVSNQFRKITVNAKGLTTATSAVAPADITTALGFTPVNRAGDTMTGPLLLVADPLSALGAATKQYVDNVASGLTAHPACVTSTTTTLAASSAGTVTYNNGVGGAGATLTTTGSFATIGGQSVVNGDRILVKDETTLANNGAYVRTSATVLTRATDFDNSPVGEVIAGDFVYIQQGTLGGTQWVQTTAGAITLGTTPLVFTQLSGAGTVTGGTGIAVTGNSIALAAGNTLSLFNLATNGLVARTASSTVTARAIAVTGVGLSVSNATGSTGDPTITSNATASNVASTIIARDASGNFSAGLITATAFNGALNGNSATATNVAYSGLTGTVPIWNQSTTGNAATATTLATTRLVNGTSFNGSADITTSTWGTSRVLSYSGDATGTGAVNGSAAVDFALTLAATGVSAGTYNNVATEVRPFTVDAKGRLTSIGTAVTITPAWTNITSRPTTIAGYGITDAMTLAGDQTASGVKTFNGTSTVVNGTSGLYTGTLFLGTRRIRNVTSTSAWELVNAANTVTIFNFDNAGNFTASADIIAYSDARLKTDIEVIPDALSKVLKLRGVNYTRTDNGDLKTGKRSTGVIAQEVQGVIPEAVSLDEQDPENGIMGVKYGNMAGLFIEAIKELKAEVDALKAEIAALKG